MCRALGHQPTTSTRLSVFIDDAVDLYRECHFVLPAFVVYALRLFIDVMLWYAAEPQRVFPFVTHRKEYLQDLPVPCEDLVPPDALGAVSRHREKLCYHGIKPTAAQEDRVPFLGLFRKILCQKYHVQHTERKLKALFHRADRARVLRYWWALTYLGNYRHATTLELPEDLRERQQFLRTWDQLRYEDVALELWTVSAKEYLMFALYQDLALFRVLDKHDGSWEAFRQATLAVCESLRGHRTDVDHRARDHLQDAHLLAATMLKPVSYWEFLTPLFKNQSGYQPDPSLVVALYNAFIRADVLVAVEATDGPETVELATLPQCHHQKYLLHRRIVYAVLEDEAAERLMEHIRDYFRGKPYADLNAFPASIDRDRIYCIVLAWYWSRRVYTMDLGLITRMAQEEATLHRVRGYTDVVAKAQQFVVCPSCFAQVSMVARAPLIQPAKSSSSRASSGKARGRKPPKPMVSSSVAGLNKVVVDLSRMITYCGRRQGKKTHNCNQSPVVRLPLLGKMLCFNQAFFTLCTRPKCGMITHFDPITMENDPIGPVCRACSALDHSSKRKRKDDQVDDDYVYDEDTGELDVVATFHKRVYKASLPPKRARLPPLKTITKKKTKTKNAKQKRKEEAVLAAFLQ